MCGIAGMVSVNKMEVSVDRLKLMTDVIAHRGPDGDGHWVSQTGNVGLGHRRLSIIDLSHEADQPMHYLGRYSIVFNGEIYNYIELKEILLKQGFQFNTESDTEVLMALYHRDKEECLQLLDGMFSFVLYDDETKQIFAARDRFGEKPFYYRYKKNEHFLFGSEMKTLWAAGVKKEVDKGMLYNYLAFGYIEDPNKPEQTFFQDCIKLPHGHYLKLSVTDCRITEIRKYYTIEWQNIDHSITEEKAKEKFHELFYTSVKRRLRSDVPLGSSLSGGLDSSLVVGVINNLNKGNTQKQNTFSAVFPGFKMDERKYMDYVINTKNVEPYFVSPTDEGFVNAIEKINWHQEEPYGSASIYAQYAVMELAKQNKVVVLLDGQGADEVLAGYHGLYIPYFEELKRTNKKLYQEQSALYNELHSTNDINPLVQQGGKNNLKSTLTALSPQLRQLFHKYKNLRSPFFNKDFFAQHGNYAITPVPQYKNLNHALYYYTYERGLQELLRYADRNSMAHSREVRLPFLSHELVNFLFTLPAEMKINKGWTKWIMRATFEKELPAEICWRKDKIGYAPPQQNWMEKKEIQDRVLNAKEKLVGLHVIDKKTLSNATNKQQDKTKDWQLLMINSLLG